MARKISWFSYSSIYIHPMIWRYFWKKKKHSTIYSILKITNMLIVLLVFVNYTLCDCVVCDCEKRKKKKNEKQTLLKRVPHTLSPSNTMYLKMYSIFNLSNLFAFINVINEGSIKNIVNVIWNIQFHWLNVFGHTQSNHNKIQFYRQQQSWKKKKTLKLNAPFLIEIMI